MPIISRDELLAKIEAGEVEETHRYFRNVGSALYSASHEFRFLVDGGLHRAVYQVEPGEEEGIPESLTAEAV